MRTAEEIAEMITVKVGLDCDYCPFTESCRDCQEIWLLWLNGEIEVE